MSSVVRLEDPRSPKISQGQRNMDTQRNTEELLREPLVIERTLRAVAIVLTLVACVMYAAPALTG
jgi:hypothetical protein